MQITRFAGNDLSPQNKAINMFGVGIQNKADLNKKEHAEYREKSKRIKQRMNKSKRNKNNLAH